MSILLGTYSQMEHTSEAIKETYAVDGLSLKKDT